jgi:hypothetical protein
VTPTSSMSSISIPVFVLGLPVAPARLNATPIDYSIQRTRRDARHAGWRAQGPYAEWARQLSIIGRCDRHGVDWVRRIQSNGCGSRTNRRCSPAGLDRGLRWPTRLGAMPPTEDCLIRTEITSRPFLTVVWNAPISEPCHPLCGGCTNMHLDALAIMLRYRELLKVDRF